MLQKKNNSENYQFYNRKGGQNDVRICITMIYDIYKIKIIGK